MQFNLTSTAMENSKNLIPMESCKEQCKAQCKNFLWNSIVNNYIFLLILALLAFSGYFYILKNKQNVLARARMIYPDYPEKSFNIFVDILFFIGLVLILVFIILVKNGIKIA